MYLKIEIFPDRKRKLKVHVVPYNPLYTYELKAYKLKSSELDQNIVNAK